VLCGFVAEKQIVTILHEQYFCCQDNRNLLFVDMFWKQIEPEFRNKAFGADDKKRRNSAFKMSDSEIITILILLRLPNP